MLLINIRVVFYGINSYSIYDTYSLYIPKYMKDRRLYIYINIYTLCRSTVISINQHLYFIYHVIK